MQATQTHNTTDTREGAPLWQHQVVEGWCLPLLFSLVHPLLCPFPSHSLLFISSVMSWVFDPVLCDWVSEWEVPKLQLWGDVPPSPWDNDTEKPPLQLVSPPPTQTPPLAHLRSHHAIPPPLPNSPTP